MIVTKRESMASLIHDTSPILRHSLQQSHNKGLYYEFIFMCPTHVHLHTIHMYIHTYIHTYIRTCVLEMILYQYRSPFVRPIAMYIAIKGMIMV